VEQELKWIKSGMVFFGWVYLKFTQVSQPHLQIHSLTHLLWHDIRHQTVSRTLGCRELSSVAVLLSVQSRHQLTTPTFPLVTSPALACLTTAPHTHMHQCQSDSQWWRLKKIWAFFKKKSDPVGLLGIDSFGLF